MAVEVHMELTLCRIHVVVTKRRDLVAFIKANNPLDSWDNLGKIAHDPGIVNPADFLTNSNICGLIPYPQPALNSLFLLVLVVPASACRTLPCAQKTPNPVQEMCSAQKCEIPLVSNF